MECPPVRAQAWLDDHTRELVCLEVDDAVALIESAGLQARVVHYPGGWMTQELRHDRVNLWLTQDGSIASLDAG